jgi:broad specificity phosphatase PhoE
LAFAQDRWKYNAPNSVVCTHNVVLRCLVGEALGVPSSQRYRIRIPHLAPIEFVSTKHFGLFVNLSESVERELFRGFVGSRLPLKHAS